MKTPSCRPATFALLLAAGLALTPVSATAQSYTSDEMGSQTELSEAEAERMHQQIALDFRAAADAADTGNREGYEAAIGRLMRTRDYAREQREANPEAESVTRWKELEDHAEQELANAGKLEVRQD
ncbi:MAG: hypothetical protein AAFQ90_10915 [Pseudomonadota bacterium]